MKRPSVEAMAASYIYTTWVNTGAIECAESGQHYRPNHHANLAMDMFRWGWISCTIICLTLFIGY